MRTVVSLFTALVVAALPAGASPQDAQPLPDKLDESTTRALVKKYKELMEKDKEQAKKGKVSDSWAVQCIILSALGKSWHPSGSEALLLAFQSKDMKLRAFALEALRRADPAAVPPISTKELVDDLITNQLGVQNALYQERLMEVLPRIAPEAKNKTAANWKSWWKKAKDTWSPPHWTAPPSEGGAPQPEAGGGGSTVAEKLVQHAFDLNQRGIELAFCLDITGSMQLTIDAAKDGINDLASMLHGIAPNLRIGLIYYQDYEDLKDGARVDLPLTDDIKKIQEHLKKTIAMGGGDIPERVEKALDIAINDPKMNDPKTGGCWTAEAYKMIVVIGDAPPHQENLADAIRIARNAHTTPFVGGGGKKDPTGKDAKEQKKESLPFVISTIGVDTNKVPDDTEQTFKAIADAGGGTYGSFLTLAKAKGKGKDKNAKEPSNADKLVEQVVRASFGKEWEKSATAFMETFSAYRGAGLFK